MIHATEGGISPILGKVTPPGPLHEDIAFLAVLLPTLIRSPIAELRMAHIVTSAKKTEMVVLLSFDLFHFTRSLYVASVNSFHCYKYA